MLRLNIYVSQQQYKNKELIMKPQKKTEPYKATYDNLAAGEFLIFEEDWLEVSEAELPNEIRKELLSY